MADKLVYILNDDIKNKILITTELIEFFILIAIQNIKITIAICKQTDKDSCREDVY